MSARAQLSLPGLAAGRGVSARELRKWAATGGHQLGPFHSVPQGIGPVATCPCGLGITQQRRGPGRGATLLWFLGKTGHSALPGVIQVALQATCPLKAYRGLPIVVGDR